MSEKLLLTPEQAAEQLGISRAQIYRLIKAKQIRTAKIGKLRRISPAALQEFVQRAEAEEVAAG